MMRLRFDGGEVVEDSARTMFEWRKSGNIPFSMSAAITSSWVVTAEAAGRVYIDCMASHYLYGFSFNSGRSFRQLGNAVAFQSSSSGVAELIYVKLD